MLSGAYRSGMWWRSWCPVRRSRGGTLALRDTERGLLVYCHAGCDRRDILAELRRLGLIEGWAESRPKPPAPGRPDTCRADHPRRAADERERQPRAAAALDLWGKSYPAGGTIVERYVYCRGITLPAPPTIRMHGMLYHRESSEYRPAMVGLVEHTERGPTGIHITYLAIDGSKKATVEPAKRSLGPVAGGAVRLAPASELLMVAEGIETGLAAMQSCGLPTWAALSASGVKALVLPPVVRKVIILADNDANAAGKQTARAAAARWLAEGRRVRIAMPPEPGCDFNDVLLGRACACDDGVDGVAA